MIKLKERERRENKVIDLYDKVEKYIENSCTPHMVRHLKRTAYWCKQLKPDADEALLIAAVSHDIERAFRNKSAPQIQRVKKFGFKDPEFLKYHQEKGAAMMAGFLEKNNANKDLIERVKTLISKHEVGGNEDQNILKDADSISFFENNVKRFLTRTDVDKEKIREKFSWMYDRITSSKAKRIAKSWYEKAIEDLESS